MKPFQSPFLHAVALMMALAQPSNSEELKYLDVHDLARRFDLKEIRIDGEPIRWSNKTVSMRLTAGRTDCVLNSVTLGLIHPVTESAGTLRVSEADLENILTPVLQPGRLANREPIRLLLVEVQDNERQNEHAETAIQSKWIDMIVAALGKGAPPQRKSIIVRKIAGGGLEKAVSEMTPADREGAVLVRLHCEGTPEYPISVKTAAPAPFAPERGPVDAVSKQAADDSIAFAVAVQGAVGRRLGKYLRDGRVDQARIPDIARVGLPAIRLVTSPPDKTGIDDKAVEPYARSIAMGIMDGIMKYDAVRTRYMTEAGS